MTRPRAFDELPPAVVTAPFVRSSAGAPIPVTLTITNRASEPRILSVTALGVDAAWLPRPSRSRPIMAGESIVAVLTLRPSEGTVPARYPLAVAVEALDPATQQATAPTSVTEVDLIVDAPGQITVTLDPVDTTAVFGKKLTVLLHNSSSAAENVRLEVRSPTSAVVDVPRGVVSVPPGTTVPVRARLNVARPSLFRRKARHAYTVTARSGGAPRYAEGSLTARPMFGPVGTKAGAVLVVLALWVALAIIFIPRLANSVRKNEAAPNKTATSSAPAKSGSKSGSGGSGSGDQTNGGGNGGSGGGSGGGGSGSGGSGGAGGAGASAAALPVQLNGTVTGNSPAGVTVTLSSVSLGSSEAAGASPVGGATTQSAAVGKIPSAALALDPQATPTKRRATTSTDGAWSFAKVTPSGYYLLAFAKAGYQTQRFIVNGATASATQPLKVALVAGQGHLSGRVHLANGSPVGGATVLISDGTNTITTSSNSTGTGRGQWSVSGLSTPSTYVVTVTRSGLGTQSQLVSLAASGTASVNTTMRTGASTIDGTVNPLVGEQTGLGGVKVSATNGTETHTTSTVTTGSQKGAFTLPDLAVGRWVITFQADGYQVQSRIIKISPDQSSNPLPIFLSSATATVTGRVHSGTTKLVGAGLILSSATNTYKQTTDNAGHFTFDGVAPGVYTLTAQYFDRVTAAQSIKAVVGAKPKVVDFDLQIPSPTTTSDIVGYVGNAVASGGALCKKGDTCTLGYKLVESETAVDDSAPGLTITVVEGATARAVGATPYHLTAAGGLQAGLYQLTVSLAGFLPATVTVRVPLNGTAVVPAINLFPANIIAGTIDTIAGADVNSVSGATVFSPGANCVLAVPIGLTYPDPTSPSPPTTCDEIAADIAANHTAGCQENGTPEPSVGVIQNGGNYRVTGLCDGRYVMHVVLGNTDFVAPTSDDEETVTHGQTAPYSPHVARKGVLVLTVNELDPDTGEVTGTLPSAVDLSCTGGAPAAASLQDVALHDGTAKIYGFPGGSTRCTVTTHGSGIAFSGDTGALQMINDTDTPILTTLNSGLAPIVGQVVTSLGDTTTATGVGGGKVISGVAQDSVVVHIQAVIGFIDGTPVLSADNTIRTDQHGCFAIVADPADTVPTPAGCDGGVDPASVLPLKLTSRTVTIRIDAGSRTQALDSQQAQFSGPLTQFAVVATPVSITGAKFTSNIATFGNPTDFTGGTVNLDTQRANGSGTVSVGIASSGQLTWLDSNIGTPGAVWPGTYHLTLRLPGYTNTSGVLVCGQVDETDGAYPASTCTLNPNQAQARGGLTGKVTSTLELPSGGTLVSGARVIAHPCNVTGAVGDPTCASTAAPATSSCPAVGTGDAQVTTNPDGTYSFADTTSPFTLTVGHYNLTVCANGLRTATTVGVNVQSGPNTQDVAMDVLGGLSGTVSGSDGTGTIPAATVTLSCVSVTGGTCPSGASRTTTTNGSGFYSFSGAVGLYFMDIGTWQVSVTADGFTTGDKDLAIVTGPNDGDLTLTANGAFTGTVLGRGSSSGTGSPLASATIKIDYCGVAGTSCTTSPPTDPRTVTSTSSGSFSFASNSTPYVLTPGKWHITITAPGYVSVDQLVAISHGANDQTFTLDALGGLSGTVFGQGLTTQQLAGATVKARICTASDTTTCTGATTVSTTTDGLGHYSFDSLSLGDWQLQVKAFGYTLASAPIKTVDSGPNTLDLTLDVNKVDEQLHVQISSSAKATKYAVVTIAPTANPSSTTTLTADPVTKLYTLTGAKPGPYTVTVAGDSSSLGASIVPTILAVNIPLIDVAPFVDNTTIPVSVYGGVVSGKVIGPAEVPGAPSGVANVNVVLTTDGTTLAKDAADQTMSTTTDSHGTFSIGGVPNGTYLVRINGPDTDPDNGFAALVVSTPVTMVFGQPQNIGTQTLVPVHQQVELTLTYDSDNTDVAAVTPRIVPTDSYGWPAMTLPLPTTSTSGTQTIATYTITSVPFGCWKLDPLALPADHPVKTPRLVSPVSSGCTAFGVSGSQSAVDSAAGYSLDEHVLTLNTTITANSVDATGLPTVQTTINGIAHTVANGATKIYLAPGTYPVTLVSDRSTKLWPMPATVSANLTHTGTTLTFTITEADLLTLTVDKYTDMVAGDSVTVKIKCVESPAQNYPTGCATASSAGTLAFNNTLVIPNLAPGKWDVEVVGTVNGTAIDKHQVVTLTSGGANKTVMANWAT